MRFCTPTNPRSALVFADPTAAKKVVDGLAAYCEARGIAARDLVGKLAGA